MPHARVPFVLTAAALVLPPAAARGQDDALRLQGLFPTGARTTLTDGGGTLRFDVINRSTGPRDARVSVTFPDRPGPRYARDVWVPAGAVRSTWLPVGPPVASGTNRAEIESVLTDRTGGGDVTVLPPGEDGKVRARPVPYRPRAPATAFVADHGAETDDPSTRAGAAVALVKAVRAAVALPPEVFGPDGGLIPPTPEAFDGVDHVVVAGNRLAADPAGGWALRRWVERGGRLWVMLDLADADGVAPLLGDERPVQVVDRVGLTAVRLHRAGESEPSPREFERPVELVRVVPGAGDRVFATANGWPAGFARPLGRGRVIFTALGAAGWLPPVAPVAPPRAKGPRAPSPGLPTADYAIQELATEVHPRGLPQSLSPDVLRPLLDDQVGYSVMGRGTAAAVLGGFLLAVVGLGVAARRSRRPELVGWLAPASAVAAAGLFVGHAELSRRAIPPTVAAAAFAEPVPGTGDVVVTGLFAAYQPDSGPVPLASAAGGVLELDGEGLEGQTRTRVQTDTDAWHFEGLSLPAGVRTGRFTHTVRAGPVAAVARFGPEGVVGRLTASGFGSAGDALLRTPTRQPLAARFDPDGGFAAAPADALPPDQFLTGTVLTDRQQRRQGVYRQLLAGPLPPHLDGRDLLLAWTETPEVSFAGREGNRAVGTALLTVPLEFERTPPGTRVTVPAAFVPVRRADAGRVTMESASPADMRLRFQLPASVLPVEVERAVLRLRVRAPGRRVAVGGLAGDRAVPLFAADGPADPVRVEVTDPALLRPDPQGGLRLSLAISGTPAGPGSVDVAWRIEELGLDVVGRTGGGP